VQYLVLLSSAAVLVTDMNPLVVLFVNALLDFDLVGLDHLGDEVEELLAALSGVGDGFYIRCTAVDVVGVDGAAYGLVELLRPVTAGDEDRSAP